ncbi:hypothetical protein JG479_09375 [Pseudoalteromonas sp. LC2018020214]|uniref:hypothetical protein n=1 Tax=Pseudoalteromonas sp. LC2018020214 TaxID=2799564 RepID=UPI0019044A4B|nr:hypothetical protein [Pseudoalteromonas sp. LC2018020214]QQM62978.1 hypothetical protein JG479_09375 [Pseudoalteromonas sp. LC2018020214]
MQFLVNPNGNPPQTLPESFRKLLNLSSGFCRSWTTQELSDAQATSEEAFEVLDHIQNELLRHRDDKRNAPNWSSHPLKVALSLPVGSLIKNATSYKQNFLSLSPGNGALPASVPVEPLSLEVALNKLKHRASIAVNFSITNSNSHSLYIFTNAGMGQPDSISEFNMDVFCNVGKQAANAI